ncbi:MAG TPA: hypothetical protein VFA20_20755 [Myxococcaceae bacterium]|nr:hypothetical protein [Myxococcaceae bacterium]
MPTKPKPKPSKTAAPDFDGAFTSLKSVFAKHQRKLAVKADTAKEHTLVGKKPSPFPQHKGHPLYFGSVRLGKAYVSLHLPSLYMHPPLAKGISPELKKRMQGLACFNFKSPPDRVLLAELKRLADVSMKDWSSKGWL